ncbi:acyltransferase domain-containing protein [Haloglycomyces albus]|uniref:acyltransferase domain-containing protein n=1 Tax=Haloglycomyces albus TaxID=526067 RepID=UPI00046D452C|nr:acyltransferase domain-containing protein [Haloglycomyces albus]
MNTELPEPDACQQYNHPSPDLVYNRLLEWCNADVLDAQEAADAAHRLSDDQVVLANRLYQDIISTMGEPAWRQWPKLPSSTPADALLGLYPLLAALDDMVNYHRQHNVNQVHSRRVMSDVGEKLRLNRRLYQRAGLDVAFWFTCHVRGSLYQLGRLQFCIEGSTTQPHLGLHIRGEGGPLSVERIADSVHLAREFFPKSFPDLFPAPEEITMTCDSWLLDPQLNDWLPARSNIRAFASLFDLIGPEENAGRDAAGDIYRFVYALPESVAPIELPRNSSMRAALADAFEAGVQWKSRVGVLNLEKVLRHT